jgi:hypothetical protein
MNAETKTTIRSAFVDDGVVAGVDRVAAGVQASGAKIVSINEQITASQARVDRATQATGASLGRLIQQMAPAINQAERMAKALAGVTAAVEAGKDPYRLGGVAVEFLEKRFQAVTEASIAAKEAIAATMAAAGTGPTKEGLDAEAFARRSAKASIDADTAALIKYEEELKRIAAAERFAGDASEEAAAARARARAGYEAAIVANEKVRQQIAKSYVEAEKSFESVRTPAEQWSATLKKISADLEANAISEDIATKARIAAAVSYGKLREAAQEAATATAEANQAHFNALLGISDPSSAEEHAKRAKAYEGLGEDMDRRAARYASLQSPEEKYQGRLREISHDVSRGIISPETGDAAKAQALAHMEAEVAKAQEMAAATARQLAAEYRALLLTHVPLAKANQAYLKQLDEIAKLRAAGEMGPNDETHARAVALKSYESDIAAYDKSVEKFADSYVKAEMAASSGKKPLEQWSSVIEKISEDLKLNAISEDIATKARIAAAVSYGKLREAAQEAATATAEANQTRYKQQLGITDPAAEEAHKKRAKDFEELGVEMDRRAARYASLQSPDDRYQAKLREISRDATRGYIEPQVADAARMEALIQKSRELAKEQEEEAAATRAMAAENRELLRSIVPISKANQDYLAELDRIQTLRERGLIGISDEAEARATAAVKYEAAIEAHDKAMQKLADSYVKVGAAIASEKSPLEQWKATLEKISEDLKANAISEDIATKARAAAAVSYGKLREAAQEAAAATAEANQTRYKQLLGITDPATEEAHAKRAKDFEQLGIEMERKAGSYANLQTPDERYQAKLRAITSDVDRGYISKDTGDAARIEAATRLQAELTREQEKGVAAARDLEFENMAIVRSHAPLRAARQEAIAQIKEINAVLRIGHITPNEADAARAKVHAEYERQVDAIAKAEERQAKLYIEWLDKVHAKVNEAITDEQRYANVIETVNQQLVRGLVTEDMATKAHQAAAATLGQRREAAAVQAQETAAANQAEINARLGVSAPPTEEEHAKLAKGFDDLGAAMDRVAARYPSLQTPAEKYDATIKQIAEDLKLGYITPKVAQGAADKAYADAQAAIAREVELAGADAKKLAAENEALMRTYSPLHAATERYKKALEDIDKIEQRNLLDGKEIAAARANALQDYEEEQRTIEKGIGINRNAAFAFRTLGIQAIQGVSGIATGQGFWTVLIQQGHQVGDIMLATGVGFGKLAQAARAAFIMISEAGLLPLIAFAAVATAIALIAMVAEKSQQRMVDFRNAMRATIDDFKQGAKDAEAAARLVSSLTPIGRADAREAAVAIRARPEFMGSTEQIAGLIKVANDLALVTGEKLPDAAKRWIADGIANPANKAQEAVGKFKGFSQALADQIKLQQDAGDKAGAFQRYLDGISRAAKGATEDMTPLSEAWHRFVNALTGPGSLGESLVVKLGTLFTTLGATILNVVAIIIEQINKLAGYMPKLGRVTTPETAAVPSVPGGVTGPAGQVPAGRVAIPQAAQTKILEIAERTNAAGDLELSAKQSDLALRIAEKESHGQQTKDGKTFLGPVIPDRPAWDNQAVGMFQIMPSTAKGLGIDPHNEEQNIQGGLKYISQLWKQFGGNVGLVAMAYNWGPHNVELLLEEIKKKPSATARVPDETRKYVTAVAGMTPETAVSAGRGGTPVSVPTAPGTPSTQSGVGNTTPDLLDKAQEAWNQANLLQRRIEQNTADQQRQVAAMVAARLEIEKAAAAGDTPRQLEMVKAYARASDVLIELKGAATDLIPEQERMARSADDATKQYLAEAGAAREAADIIERYREESRRSGKPVDQISLSRELTSLQTRLNATMEDGVKVQDRATAARLRAIAVIKQGAAAEELAANEARAREEALRTGGVGTAPYTAAYERLKKAADDASRAGWAEGLEKTHVAMQVAIADQQKLIPFLEKGGQAAEHEANALRAAEEAKKYGPPGTPEYATAKKTLQSDYNEQTRLKYDEMAAQDIHVLTQQNEMIAAQTRLITASNSVRAKELAILQERQRLGLAVGAQASQEQQKAIDLAGTTAEAGVHMQELEQSYQAVVGSIGQEFDKIGEAITNSSHSTDTFAQRMRKMATSVLEDIQKMIIKMAIINPLMNQMFGTSLPTLSNAMEASQKGTEGAGGGGAIGGMVGWIGKLFGSSTSGTGKPEALSGSDSYGSGGAMKGVADNSGWSTAESGGWSNVAEAHVGWLVGSHPAVSRMMPADAFTDAPRYHTGMGPDEFAAVLQKGERVMTASQDNRNTAVLKGLAAQASNRQGDQHINFNIQTPDADSFRSSQGQLTAKASAALSRTSRRGN